MRYHRSRALFISEHGDPLAPVGGRQSGGQNVYVQQLALALEKRGWSVDCVTHWDSPDLPEIEVFGNDNRVIRVAAGYLGFIPKEKLWVYLPQFLNEIYQKLDLENYRILHTHYWMSGWLGQHLQQKMDIPWIHTAHSLQLLKQDLPSPMESHVQRRIHVERANFEHADHIVATSPQEKKIIQHRYSPLPDQRFSVIPAGINPSIFYPRSLEASRQKCGIPLNRQMLFFAGRFVKQKALDILLEAFILLRNKQKFQQVHLYVGGGDSIELPPERWSMEKQALVSKINQAGIASFVHFLGPLDQAVLADYFASADGVVVPSRYESFGMIAAEAQACGAAVIASSTGGLTFVVQDKKTGWTFPPEDPVALAASLEHLLTSPLERERRKMLATERIHKEMSWSAVAKKMHEVYLQTMSLHQKKKTADVNTHLLPRIL